MAITKSDWANFVDNNIVSDKLLNSIVDKYKKGTSLSQHEQAIFTDRIKEIEIKLKQ